MACGIRHLIAYHGFSIEAEEIICCKSNSIYTGIRDHFKLSLHVIPPSVSKTYLHISPRRTIILQVKS